MEIKELLADALVTDAAFQVKVIPRASVNRIVLDARSESAPPLRVYVTSAPESGRANAAVTKLLARALGVPKSSLILLRGKTGRLKTFRIIR